MKILILTGQNEGKRDRGNQRITYMVRMSDYMGEYVIREITKMKNLVKAIKARTLWRANISKVLRGDGA